MAVSTISQAGLDAPITLTSPTLTSPSISGTPVMGASVITSGTAQASTSGTSIDFTSIPSWVKRITVLLSGVSTSGTSPLTLRLGTSSGVTATGYTGSAFYTSSVGNFSLDTTGFPLTTTALTAAASTYRGSIIVSLLGSNIWVAQGTLYCSTSGGTSVWVSSEITLASTLDRVRITTVNGTDTFDAGSINILYE